MADRAEHRAPQPTGDHARRYSAFISYSHADEAFARRLHRRLEGYRLPRGTVGARVSARRLKPIFRDNDELTAAADLSTAVQEALAQSEHLIVVCSPSSAQSKWVGREIEHFRRLRGDEGILTALIDGEPETAFHSALRPGGRGRKLEPLAADFRPGGPGSRMALLKLVGPLAGAPLDDLVQRDARRRIQQVSSLAALGLVGMSVLGVLTAVAVLERTAAERERNKAQAMVGYMVTDLRNGVRGVGNLELLDKVNKGASAYYKGQDLSHMSDAALQQRAKLLQAMGEDNEKRGDLKTARGQFEEARRTTSALLSKTPNDPQRIFDQAQSEYWVGFINWRNGDGAAARAGFGAYADLAQRLVRIDPRNDAWVMEVVYASNGQGMLALRQDGDAARAEPYYRASIAQLQAISQRKPGDRGNLISLANAYAWLADCQRLEGDPAGALASREAQRKALLAILAAKPRDAGAEEGLLSHDLGVARIEIEQGELKRAVGRLDAGRREALDLQRNDPQNADFGKQARMFELFKVRAWLAMPGRSRPNAAKIEKVLGECRPSAPALANEEIGDFCAVLLARQRAALGDDAGAAAALAPVRDHARKRHDVLTAHWGLNLAEEARAIQVADSGGVAR